MTKEEAAMKHSWWAVAVATLAILVAGPLPSEAQKKLKIAIVLPGVITDKAWNELGHQGLKGIEKDLGAEVAFIERVAQPDQAEAMGDFARRGFDLVFRSEERRVGKECRL